MGRLGTPILDVARELVLFGLAPTKALVAAAFSMSLAMRAHGGHRFERALHELARRRHRHGLGRSTGFGMEGAAEALWMRVINSRASCSSTSSLCDATAISPVAFALGNTGNGVFARRGSSVLPPPSRLDCARISATAGFSFDFAFTSATSSGGVRS